MFSTSCEMVVGREWREAEESPLLEAVTRERLMKIEKARKCLAGAVVI
jgi:hypothetical protein